jgi:hypothetical protein
MKAPQFSLCWTAVLLACVLSFSRTASAASCSHYAAPNGTGNGLSSSQPFKIADFWPAAKPGHTLCLLDGQYTGAASMINPPQYLSGTASGQITVRAANDGKVTINGQGKLFPVRLYRNNYFVLEGFNASNSVATVVGISESNYNIVRRVAAWDAADNNTNIFGIRGQHNLLEDVAGWGVARKTFSSSQGGNYITIRRAWGRWEGSHVTGPKMTYTLAYNNYNMTCENCIGTWSGERMKQTYRLLGYDGKPWTGGSGGTYTNYAASSPYGIFATDGLAGNKNAQSKILGSIGYVKRNDRLNAPQVVFATQVDFVEISNTVAYIEPGAHPSKKRFVLNNLSTVAQNLTARNLTGVGGAGSYYGSDWEKTAISEGSSLSAVSNVYSSSIGANLCKRYENRVLTSKPLWPWPMNQRIINGLIESGRAAVDVTKTIEGMFGPIPSSCKGTTGLVASNTLGAISSTALAIPSSPVDLQAAP